ncbi:DUF618-domain-containing protein [Delitschia confertaspora ATCC 74209]|uniref:DUF618-domain-containing protein n=1 Tax=Delitschia confertaspora ATCC 74209 TaxID=1513339 RepID=A0A9P4JF35_9PLEO|nr:DUF618-domain-containing protein [Delitschia confertaspora ATCC 74209]
MAFTDDAVKAKLSSLNESQEAIVTVAQWIMFHRRQADRTAQLWMQRIKESTPSKKLNLIYLANEVVQQSKMRKKMEFVNSYSPIIAEATTAAYKGSPSDVQQKIRRVVEVWRQRQIFDVPIQDTIEKALDEVDRTRGSKGKATLGGSLFSSSSSSIPTDLQPLVPLQNALSKADIHTKPAITTANEEYTKLTTNPLPTPPVHAARLATLLKSLANAEGAVAESIKARHALISGLSKLLETNRATLQKEEAQRADLTIKKVAIENKKRDVEDAIMRGLSVAETATHTVSSALLPGAEPSRPDIEELTPPPMESFTPTGSPGPADFGDDIMPTASSHPIEPVNVPPPASAPAPSFGTSSGPIPLTTPGADLLSSLTRGRVTDDLNGGYHGPSPTAKKRKMSRSAAEDEFAAFAGDGEMEDLDADVAGMLEG